MIRFDRRLMLDRWFIVSSGCLLGGVRPGMILAAEDSGKAVMWRVAVRAAAVLAGMLGVQGV